MRRAGGGIHERGAKVSVSGLRGETEPDATAVPARPPGREDDAPAEKHQRQLRDQHVLVDTVRMRSAALLVQQAQEQKAIEA